jgi:hypothetical protein
VAALRRTQPSSDFGSRTDVVIIGSASVPASQRRPLPRGRRHSGTPEGDHTNSAHTHPARRLMIAATIGL